MFNRIKSIIFEMPTWLVTTLAFAPLLINVRLGLFSISLGAANFLTKRYTGKSWLDYIYAQDNPKEHYVNLYQQIQSLNHEKDLSFSGTFENVLSKHALYINRNGKLRINHTINEGLGYESRHATQIALAIVAMAKKFPDTDPYAKWQHAQKGVYYLLKAFSKIAPTETVLKIKWDYFRYCTKLAKKMNQADDLLLTDTSSAILIQRAYRKFRYIKARKRSLSSKDEHKGMDYREDPKFADFLNPPAPKSIHFLSGKEKRRWAEEMVGKYGSLSQKIADNVTYRSHAAFMNRLAYVAEKFNQYIHSLPVDKRTYALVIPEKRGYSSGSNHWVTSLALRYLSKLPQAIISVKQAKDYVKAHPEIQHLVYIDDAIYSGRQLNDHLSETSFGIRQVIIVPFYNHNGLTKISSDVIKIVGERMYTPSDLNRAYLWSDEEIQKFDSIFDSEWSMPSTKVGVYFQHTIADSASTYLASLTAQHDEPRLVPEVPRSPYRRT